MQDQNKPMPLVDELILCTVTAIQYHSVFCSLDEYGGRTGMIHISEIAPGRIRNIREFVEVGKKVVCKVLRIDHEKGHIDLSLRRVSVLQRQQKLNQLKQEQIAEKILEYAAKQCNEQPGKLHEQIMAKVTGKYNSIFSLFEAVALGDESLDKLGIDPATVKHICEAIKTRIKPPKIFIDGDIMLSSYAPEGVELIKMALAEAEKVQDNHLMIRYKGAGIYHIHIEGKDYKSAEKTLKKAVDACVGYAEKHDMQVSFQRAEAQ
jgi:translation initiation factor 2 subunit 1